MAKPDSFPMTNKMKQNEADFCRRASVNRPRSHGTFAERRRQNERIMSPKDGTPPATTICIHKPANDLRTTLAEAVKQNSKNPQRQHHLFTQSAQPPTKCPQVSPPCSLLSPPRFPPFPPHFPVFHDFSEFAPNLLAEQHVLAESAGPARPAGTPRDASLDAPRNAWEA